MPPSSHSSKAESILLNQPCREDLEYICAVLNSEMEPAVKEELERIIRIWWSCQTSQEMLAAHPQLVYELRTGFRVSMLPSPTGRRFDLRFPAHITLDGKVIRRYIREPPKQRALALLAVLVTHPQGDKLAGPCECCGQYFLKKTIKQLVRESAELERGAYCSRNCRSLVSARIATLKRRKDEHAQKLLRASEAAAMWDPQRTRLDWKDFVSSKHLDITRKWLTRAVHRDELQDPTVFQKGVTATKGAHENA